MTGTKSYVSKNNSMHHNQVLELLKHKQTKNYRLSGDLQLCEITATRQELTIAIAIAIAITIAIESNNRYAYTQRLVIFSGVK